MQLDNARRAAVVAVSRVGYTEKLSIVVAEEKNVAG
jgi:hypothetical protein